MNRIRISVVILCCVVTIFSGGYARADKDKSELASRFLDASLKKGNGRFYLGRCSFSENLSSARIWLDGMTWYRIITKKDGKKYKFMEFFARTVWFASVSVGEDRELHPDFELVNQDGSVMARGVFKNGILMTEFVEPKYWKRW